MENEAAIKLETIACDHCGKFGAIEIGEKFLCADCITLAGCACAEREMDL